jgi:hypothetical protein
MKHLLFIFLFLPCVLSATALLRQTSERQNAVQAPSNGELVYAVNGDGSVSAFVGRNGSALPVVDTDAVRLARASAFTPEELDIDSTGTVTVAGDDVAYSVGTVTITQMNKEAIGMVDWETFCPSGVMIPPTSAASVSVDGNVATITVTEGQICKVRVFPAAPVPEIDITHRDVTLTDARGTVRFSRLRQSIFDDLNGNLGRDWAVHPARTIVNTNGHPLSFGTGSGSAIDGAPGRLTCYAGGVPVLAATATGANGEVTTGTIAIESLVATDTSVTIVATCQTIDPSIVSVQHTAVLTDAVWLDVTPTSKTVSGSKVTIVVPRDATAKAGFYRLRATDAVVSVVITVAGDLEVTGRLILASPSGKRFAITISDAGAISATEVTE